MNCVQTEKGHVYARRMDGSRVCVMCTSPEPPLDEAVIRELGSGIRTINALHMKDARFDMTIVRGADSGMTMLEVMERVVDELLVRRARG